MATFLAMPKLGLNMTHGVIVGWLVEEGDSIEEGKAILEIETDKAMQEVEAPTSGVMGKILKSAGEEVPCNHVIGVILEPGEEIPSEIPDVIAEGVGPVSEVQASSDTGGGAQEIKEQKRSKKRISISPSARKLAEELGVDIYEIEPEGKRIKRSDVEAAHQQMKSEGGESKKSAIEKSKMSNIRRRTAEHMDKSARSVARVGLTLELDATNLIQAREQLRIDDAKISYNVLLAKQVGKALLEYPYMNAQIRDDEVWTFPDANIGIAVDADKGLFVPVLKQVNQKSVEELQREFARLAERALEGKANITDLEGGTFTITNLGSLGIEEFLPVINVPECAILGVGSMVDKPVVLDGGLHIQPRMKVTLAFDHRLVDGAPAARFLKRLKELLETVSV